MKFNHLLILLMLAGGNLAAQPDSIRFLCKDIVKVMGNNRYVGTVTQIDSAGYLKITTWSGMLITLPRSIVTNIEQECVPRGKGGHWRREHPPFRETGWYQHSRFVLASGQTGGGLFLQHSIGYRFSHWLHTGLGTGIENFSIGEEPANYPLFLECRAFLLSGRISPFLAAGGGWSWMGKSEVNTWNGEMETWKGGPLGFVQAGYRFGNHLIVYFGVRVQRQQRNWEQPWGNWRGVDRIVKRRMEIGIGVYL